MCGRLACGLDPEQVRNCCLYTKPGDSNKVKPAWKNVYNSGKKYKPSYNICPTEVAPVLVSGDHFEMTNSRVIAPMVFGLIPSWSKVDAVSKYSTINCRIESITTSRLYGPLLQRGQRCIVICNGFIEWKKENKQSGKPYFIHAEQQPDVQMDDPNTWNTDSADESRCQGLRPLRLAALFERQTLNKSQSEDETISFTIITKEASSKFSWLHTRIPAILDTDEQMRVWLNHKEFNSQEALNCIGHFEKVIWYPITSAVNTTSNKDINCISQRPVEEVSKGSKGSASILSNWLSKGKKRTDESNEEDKEGDGESPSQKKKKFS